ncbi:MAG: Mur ligase family protein [Bdellovibrionota bacterium]|nr:MAG: Mur ligase family protein [Bdellovibrionota bacterium]
MTIPVQSSDYFSVAGVTPLTTLAPGACVHIIGVGGVAMAQLAVALSECGYRVSGSDKQLYEPMRSFLKGSAVQVAEQYSPNNISKDLDLVVIGNVVSYGHPEVMEVERLRIPYTLFPRCLYELIIQGRHSIVVSGTHGKSTTTGLLAVALRFLGAKPSFFVGAALQGLERSLCIDGGAVSVVEGDEYDSAFFAKVPKFNFYKPQSLVVTAIEFDHADIYSSLEEIKQQFRALIAAMPAGSLVACCLDDEGVREQLALWRSHPNAPRFVSYGVSKDADVRIVNCSYHDGFQEVELFDSRRHKALNLQLQLAGLHNARNAASTYIVLEDLGNDDPRIVEAIRSYRGAKRRQEIRFDQGACTLIDDFAHHPTAVRETIAAVRQRFPGRRIRAVFEPRSNTSRKKVFQSEYVSAFATADEVVLSYVTPSVHDTANDLLDVRELGQAIAHSGKPVQVLPDPAAIAEHLLSSLKKGDLLLIMSNGSFGGLVQTLADRLPSAASSV